MSINLSYKELLEKEPFGVAEEEKKDLLTKYLVSLTEKHIKQSPEYQKMLGSIGYNAEKITSYKDIPFLPVSLFKEMKLKSISDEEVFKLMTSSGTSGQKVSKIFLDKATSSNQQRTIVKIVTDFIGSKRLPMLIIDSPSVIKKREMFSARGAGILGFSIFGTDKTYALNEDMSLNLEGINKFLDKHEGEKVLIFGFTFMIWEYLYKSLMSMGRKLDISNGILVHGGGWKKMISESVSKEEYKQKIKDVCNVQNVHDYYGMVEQTGCIYMECEQGHLHASTYSDIIIRNHFDFSECKVGEVGLIEVVSPLPESYPGHILLTEDEGRVLGVDDCKCGRKGKYFEVLGRIKNAEIRGCSDTHEKR